MLLGQMLQDLASRIGSLFEVSIVSKRSLLNAELSGQKRERQFRRYLEEGERPKMSSEKMHPSGEGGFRAPEGFIHFKSSLFREPGEKLMTNVGLYGPLGVGG
jgi:hypothetical protein